MNYCFVLLLLIMSFSGRSIAAEGTILLKNGNVISGTVEKNKDGSCWVHVNNGSIKFDKNEIKRVHTHEEKNAKRKRSANSPQTIPHAAKSDSNEELYDEIINRAAKKHELDPALVKAVVKAESNFRRFGTSSKGACGLMQLMPNTAHKLGVEHIYEPKENINAGTRYLKEMLVMFEGDLEKALAAYNAGPRAVMKYDAVPPYTETKRYIKNVYKNYKGYTYFENIYSFTDENGCLNLYNVK